MAVGDVKRAIGRKKGPATVAGGLKPESTPGVSPVARAAASRTDRGSSYSLQSTRNKRRNTKNKLATSVRNPLA